MKKNCVYDVLIPFYQILLQQEGRIRPWTCHEVASSLGMDPNQIRSRCLNRLRAEGYIMNAQVSDLTLKPKIRANSAGHGKTYWVFTGKFKNMAGGRRLGKIQQGPVLSSLPEDCVF